MPANVNRNEYKNIVGNVINNYQLFSYFLSSRRRSLRRRNSASDFFEAEIAKSKALISVWRYCFYIRRSRGKPARDFCGDVRHFYYSCRRPQREIIREIKDCAALPFLTAAGTISIFLLGSQEEDKRQREQSARVSAADWCWLSCVATLSRIVTDKSVFCLGFAAQRRLTRIRLYENV